MVRLPLLLVATLTTTLVTMSGCSSGANTPELGTVHGTVTLNGRTVSGLLLFFQPDAGGTRSIAKVENNGDYKAVYYTGQEGVDGVPVGPCTVSVNPVMGRPDWGEVPDRYGAKSELKLEVLPGDNTFDIAMKSN